MDLIDIYRTFHPKTMTFTFFSSTHRNFSRIDQISWAINLALVNSKILKSCQASFLTTMQLRLDVNYRRRTIKISNIWRQNNTLLNNQQIIEEIKKEIKICIERNENENTTQNLWDTVKAVLRGRFIAVQLTSKNNKRVK